MTTTYTRILLARTHAATHRTHLLLNQCRHGKPGTTTATVQSTWYAQQQQNFLEWLEAGGLAQAPAELPAANNASAIGNSGIAPLFPAPCTDADEELQFSQVRIRDAVK
jgi:hypothetical protein